MNRFDAHGRRTSRRGLRFAASVGLVLLLSASVPTTFGQVEASRETEGRSLFGSIRNLFQKEKVETQATKSENRSDSDSGALRGLSGGYSTPTTAPPPSEDGKINLDFNTFPDGTPVKRGEYIGTQYLAYGLTFNATGGYGSLPRIFDTSEVGNVKFGDADLGTPNSRCPQGGPGVGLGGIPGAEGENCEFLGNVLIVQEANADVSIPDDSGDGGVIFFDFTTPARYIYDMRFIDIDYASSITVYYLTESGDLAEKFINLDLLGDNAVSKATVNTANVKHLKVTFERSGAISDITFIPGTSSPAPVNPTLAPTKPTPAPIALTPAPVNNAPPAAAPTTGDCINVNLDFSVSGDGTPLSRGDYVSDNFALQGLLLSAAGGLGTSPRIFDTSNVGDEEFGDFDLGTPNEKCSPAGPGVGVGGEPGKPGENCVFLGNALIIQEDNANPSVPDDNVDGGTITFEFITEAQFVYEIGLLDIDYASTLTVYYREGSKIVKKVINLKLLGDNSGTQLSECFIMNRLATDGALTQFFLPFVLSICSPNPSDQSTEC